MASNISATVNLPAWLPDAVRLYLDHTEEGLSLRELARRKGCAASTVMRHVRRYENRRDDPLVDAALASLSQLQHAQAPDPKTKDGPEMTAQIRPATAAPLVLDEAAIASEGRRVLRRLAEIGAVLAFASDMEKAAVIKQGADGRMAQTAVVDRATAQAFALKDWISCAKPGRIASYTITSAGRAALKRMIEAEDQRRMPGMNEGSAVFGAQHREWAERDVREEGGARRIRFNAAESPVAVLARRRDKDGKVFLEPELVNAAERLREDFELAQMGPRVAQNWDRFMTGADRGGYRADAGGGRGPAVARERVATALRDLGPGLGDMVLRCCCFLEGLEVAEKRMGWSARSGKIVLRIALQRLRAHYDETYGRSGPLIG